jgi:hypothetical protein
MPKKNSKPMFKSLTIASLDEARAGLTVSGFPSAAHAAIVSPIR